MDALTLYWILGYKIKEGKASEFGEFLRSQRFKSLREKLQTETGIRIAETYFTVEPSSNEHGDYDAWDIWEVPNYAAIDRYVQSKARLEFFQEYLGPYVGTSYKWITAQKQEFLK